MDFRRLVWKQVGKSNLLVSEIESGFEEPGGTPPPRIPRTPPPPSDYGMCKWRIIQKLIILSKVNINLIKRVELKSVTGKEFCLLRNTVSFSTIIT